MTGLGTFGGIEGRSSPCIVHGACVPPRRERAGGGRLAGVRARRGPSIQTSTLILSPHPLLSSLPSAPNNLVRSTIQGRTDDPQFSARSAATSPCAPRSRRSVSSLEEPHIGTADWQASLEVYIDRVPRSLWPEVRRATWEGGVWSIESINTPCSSSQDYSLCHRHICHVPWSNSSYVSLCSLSSCGVHTSLRSRPRLQYVRWSLYARWEVWGPGRWRTCR